MLLGGDPGIGKSTLLLQLAGLMALGDSSEAQQDDGATPRAVLYVSGEESAEQVTFQPAHEAVVFDVVGVNWQVQEHNICVSTIKNAFSVQAVSNTCVLSKCSCFIPCWQHDTVPLTSADLILRTGSKTHSLRAGGQQRKAHRARRQRPGSLRVQCDLPGQHHAGNGGDAPPCSHHRQHTDRVSGRGLGQRWQRVSGLYTCLNVQADRLMNQLLHLVASSLCFFLQISTHASAHLAAE